MAENVKEFIKNQFYYSSVATVQIYIKERIINLLKVSPGLIDIPSQSKASALVVGL
jgi:hypothetical protein